MKQISLFLIFSLFISMPSAHAMDSVKQFFKCVRGGKYYDAQKTKKYRYWTLAGIASTAVGTIAAFKIGHMYWPKKEQYKAPEKSYPTKPATCQNEQIQLDQLLETAVKYSKFNMVKLLLGLHASANAKNRRGETPLFAAKTKEIAQILVDNNANINECDHEGNTPLMQAACNGYKDVVTVLVDHEAKLNATNKYGKTAINRVKIQKTQCTPPEYAHYNAIINYLESTLRILDTNLIPAVKNSNLELVTRLLAQGANANVKIGNAVPLFFAKTKEIAQVLIAAGANVNEQNSLKNTPLIEATRWGNADVVEVLLEHGADVTMEDYDGKIPFYIACCYTGDQYKRIIDLLQKKMQQGTA